MNTKLYTYVKAHSLISASLASQFQSSAITGRSNSLYLPVSPLGKSLSNNAALISVNISSSSRSASIWTKSVGGTEEFIVLYPW